MSARITSVENGSLAHIAGLRQNDIIYRINDIEIIDYLDYMYASCAENVIVELSDRCVEIVNEDFEPLGITFDTLLIDEPKHCRNKCVFCFIDQLPDGMRESCYFKDDDFRLSFLQGNYVTMTNMDDKDIDRILRYNLPRINVSVHTTNPELRCKMLRNKNAGKINEYLKRLADGGLNINAQIVLCPNYNDKAELDRTLSDIDKIGYSVESVSVVPVGLSDHRQYLAEIEPFTKETAGDTIDQIEKWQKKFKQKYGTNLVYASDEFYITAEREFPSYDEYDGFPQIENGVGLCASLIDEFDDALKLKRGHKPKSKKTVVTGLCAYDVMNNLVGKLDGDMVQVIPIRNDFFGNKITVTGLLTGRDIINQLRGAECGETLLLSASMLKHGENVLLDDTTTDDIERELNIKTEIVANDGYELLDALLK